MADNNGWSMSKLACIASWVIIIINPIGIINPNFRQSFGVSYQLCFKHDQMCDINAYVELVGTALPLTILTYLILLMFSNKQEKFVGFLILLVAFAVAHAKHA